MGKKAIIILVFLVGVVCTCVKTSIDYLNSPQGREALRCAKEVIYNAVVYPVKEFTKLLGWAGIKVVSSAKKVAKAISNAISWARENLKVSNTVITYRTTTFVPSFMGIAAGEYTIANVAINNLKRGKCYIAYLAKRLGNVFIGPEIPIALAKSVVLADQENYGIFMFSGLDAEEFISSIGPYKKHEPHGGDGFFWHYHLRIGKSEDTRHAHVWYFWGC